MKDKVSLALISLLSSVVLSCAAQPQQKIGNAISGPYELISAHGGKGFYVLNGAASAEFDEGSIAWMTAGSDGTPKVQTAFAIPRLGMQMALSRDSKLIAVSFFGEPSVTRFYDVESPGVIKERASATFALPSGAPIDQLKFFVPKGAAAGEYYLLGVSNRDTSIAKVHVIKIASAVENILTLPDALPESKPALYNLGYQAPSYLEDEALLLAFPHIPSLNVLPTDANVGTSIWDIALGRWTPVRAIPEKFENKGAPIDVRGGSVLALDWEKFVADGNVRNASGYFPFVTDKDFKQLDPNVTVTDELKKEKEALYRNNIQNTKSVLEDGCYDGKDAASQALPRDTLLVVDDFPSNAAKFGNIVRVNGWADVKTKLAALPALEESNYDYLKKLFYPTLTSELYAATTEPDNDRTRVLRIVVPDLNSKCVPVWTRIRLTKNGNAYAGGMEAASVQMRGEDAKNSKSVPAPRGAFGFTVVGGYAYSASYSYDTIATIPLDENGFK